MEGQQQRHTGCTCPLLGPRGCAAAEEKDLTLHLTRSLRLLWVPRGSVPHRPPRETRCQRGPKPLLAVVVGRSVRTGKEVSSSPFTALQKLGAVKVQDFRSREAHTSLLRHQASPALSVGRLCCEKLLPYIHPFFWGSIKWSCNLIFRCLSYEFVLFSTACKLITAEGLPVETHLALCTLWNSGNYSVLME